MKGYAFNGFTSMPRTPLPPPQVPKFFTFYVFQSFFMETQKGKRTLPCIGSSPTQTCHSVHTAIILPFTAYKISRAFRNRNAVIHIFRLTVPLCFGPWRFHRLCLLVSNQYPVKTRWSHCIFSVVTNNTVTCSVTLCVSICTRIPATEIPQSGICWLRM